MLDATRPQHIWRISGRTQSRTTKHAPRAMNRMTTVEWRRRRQLSGEACRRAARRMTVEANKWGQRIVRFIEDTEENVYITPHCLVSPASPLSGRVSLGGPGRVVDAHPGHPSGLSAQASTAAALDRNATRRPWPIMRCDTTRRRGPDGSGGRRSGYRTYVVAPGNVPKTVPLPVQRGTVRYGARVPTVASRTR